MTDDVKSIARRGILGGLAAGAGVLAMAGRAHAAEGISDTAWYDTITEMENDTTSWASSPDVAVVSGYHSADGGGGGVFFKDSTSTDAANHGTIFEKAGITTGRWFRVTNPDAVYVLDFGASASAANNATEIGRALTYAIASGINTLDFGNQDLKVTSTIAIEDNWTLRNGGLICNANLGSAPTLRLGDGSVGISVSLLNFNVTAPTVDGVPVFSGQLGILAQKLIRGVWEKGIISGFGGSGGKGILMVQCTGLKTYDMAVSYCETGLRFETNAGLWNSACKFYNSYFERCGTPVVSPMDAVSLTGTSASQISFHSATFQSNDGVAVDIDSGYGWTLQDCYFEKNNGAHIKISNKLADAAQSIRVIGCYFSTLLTLLPKIGHIHLTSGKVRRTVMLGNYFESANTPVVGGYLSAFYGNGGQAVDDTLLNPKTLDVSGSLSAQSIDVSGGLSAQNVETRMLKLTPPSGGGGGEEAEISSGALDVTGHGFLRVKGEGNQPDTLVTMTGGVNGQIVVLQAYDNNIPITINGAWAIADDIKLPAGGVTLNLVFDTATFIYDARGARWLMIGYCDNV